MQKKIVTLTVNPAIDKSTTVDRLRPDSKLRCAQPKFEPGGGGINVSRALGRVGGTSRAVYLGGGHTGAFYGELLRKHNVDGLAVQIERPTRENFVVVDEATGQQFRFGMSGPEVSAAEADACLETLRELPGEIDYLVASGSLAPGMDDDFYARVGEVARARGARYVLDTSGEPLRRGVEGGVFLLKPNLGELARLTGVESVQTDMVPRLARELIGDGRCRMVVVSRGPAGALLVTADEARHVPAPTVRKRSTVGAGDSMVAGMVWALAQGWELVDVVRYGVACGTAATMNSGTELCHADDVNHLYEYLKSLT
ncbi:MAG: 1-phosphofructokinase family hexose kinase [Catalinimonas sp.]